MGEVGLDTPIDIIGFTGRTRNTLRRAKIDTFGDLMHVYERGDLRRVRDLGKVQYNEILNLILNVSDYEIPKKPESWPYLYSENYHIPEEIENLPIDDMRFDTRLRNCLYRNGYRTVGEIMRIKKESIISIRGLGEALVSELVGEVSKIEKMGPEYFADKDPRQEPIEPDKLRMVDTETVRNLINNFGLKRKWVLEWYCASANWLRETLLRNKKRGNWLNRTLSEEDIEHIRHMIVNYLKEYQPFVGKQMYFLNNQKDDCAFVIVTDTEIKCFYLSMLPDQLQEMVRRARLDSITSEEFAAIEEGVFISVLRKEFFHPKDTMKFSKLAQKRDMNCDKYSIFLTGKPYMGRMYSVTDERIVEFLRNHYRNGRIVMPPGESCHWFWAFISRNGHSLKDVLELYGFQTTRK